MKEKLRPYISYEDILRFLHYRQKEITPELYAQIDEALDIVFANASFREVHKKIPIKIRQQTIYLPDQSALPYPSLVELFSSCESIYVVACTLGHDISRLIRREMAVDPSKGVMLDACASMVTDAFAAYIQSTLGYTTSRFSPGYCEVPLSTQPIFASLLEIEKRVGIHLTEGHLMVPEKSIIYLTGELDQKDEREPLSCAKCQRDCIYRKV